MNGVISPCRARTLQPSSTMLSEVVVHLPVVWFQVICSWSITEFEANDRSTDNRSEMPFGSSNGRLST